MSLHADIESSRRARRAQVYMSGELVVGSASVKVTIRDISVVGAHVVAPDALTIGSTVRLKRGILDAPAKVAWVRGREAGLQFETALAVTLLERALPQAIARSLHIPDGAA